MKKIVLKFGSVVASFALIIATVASNQACGLIMNQPELPEKVKSLRKF